MRVGFSSDPCPWLCLALSSCPSFGYLSTVALTVSVSDSCLGNKPDIRRSLKKLSGPTLLKILHASLEVGVKSFIAGFLVTVAVCAVGFSLGMTTSSPISKWLTVVGLIAGNFVVFLVFTARIFFLPAIVVLEQRGVAESLKRSVSLGRGFFARNYILFGLVLIMPMVVTFIVGIAIDVIKARYFDIPLLGGNVMFNIGIALGTVIGVAGAPLIVIVVIVMYYDMRVRKESFDATVLAEDLIR